MINITINHVISDLIAYLVLAYLIDSTFFLQCKINRLGLFTKLQFSYTMVMGFWL